MQVIKVLILAACLAVASTEAEVKNELSGNRRLRSSMSRKLYLRFRRRSKGLDTLEDSSIDDSVSTITTSTDSTSQRRKKRSDGSDDAENDSSDTGEGESKLIKSQEANILVLPGMAFSLHFHRPSYFVNPFESFTPTPVPTPALTSPSPAPQIAKMRKNLIQEVPNAATDDVPHFTS
jgi:hypothetical protein